MKLTEPQILTLRRLAESDRPMPISRSTVGAYVGGTSVKVLRRLGLVALTRDPWGIGHQAEITDAGRRVVEENPR